MSIREEVLARELPALDASQEQRAEKLALLRREFLGCWPDNVRASFQLISADEEACGGKGISCFLRATLEKDGVQADFPFSVTIPKKAARPVPVFVHLHFPNEAACGMTEELLDRGYAVASVCYEEIETDDSKPAASPMAELSDDVSRSRWGKIGEWAFAAHCIADYLLTMSEIDGKRMAVIGHSRLGLTALWCGANDPRFSLTVGVNAGGLYRGSECEQFADLAREYTRYWFCPAFFDRTLDASALPFDLHFLLSLIAPRHLLMIGASRDRWASPHSMLLAACAASPAYEQLGLQGICAPYVPQTGTLYGEGRIGFYIRDGIHYFGREEWLAAMEYREMHQV